MKYIFTAFTVLYFIIAASNFAFAEMILMPMKSKIILNTLPRMKPQAENPELKGGQLAADYIRGKIERFRAETAL